MGAGFLGVEVPERDIGAEEVYGVTDGGGVSNSGSGFEDAGKGGCFKETGEEEVPL